MSDEFERIERIKELLARVDWDIDIGIGDDAAVLRAVDEEQALSVDACIEGIHFERRFASYHDLGRRAVLCAASDLVAMGATGRASLVSLSLPSDVNDPDFYSLVEGIGEAADRSGAHVIGGNLSKSSVLSIHTTVIGSLYRPAIRRSTARPANRIFITGVLGSAAIGLRVLQNELLEFPHRDHFVQSWLMPDVPFELARELGAKATAAIDISDGLAQDLSHLCNDSGVGAVIEEALLPVHPALDEAAEHFGTTGLALALHGGEDYQVLFTCNEATVPFDATCIGRIVEGSGVSMIRKNGESEAVVCTGYRHRW
ncbi:MAG: thiamine-phosphate kinase [Polyangiales bacterium]